MLIKCPECELQVSDKANSCPHCGNPMQSNIKPKAKRKSNRKRRLPNGFGQITELKNKNLRKPFRAMVTTGKNESGRPICKLLKPDAYFSTYNEAYAALIEYNRNPCDLEASMTVQELYDRWSVEYFSSLKSDSSVRTVKSAWAYCSSVYDMRVVDLRARHMKYCIDNGTTVIKNVEKHTTPNIKGRIKSTFNLMLDYAVEYELVDRNYARTFNLSEEIVKEKEKARKEHIPFTNDEINLLWENIGAVQHVDLVLIQCYSGWRPQELGLIRLEDVDLENWTFRGGMKSDAGTDRIVPIHSKIRDLVVRKYNEAKELNSEYLLNCADTHTVRSTIELTYDKYKNRYATIRDRLKLNPEHKPHDPRMHFITMAKKYGVDEYAIKYIVGHAINDVTEKVYTKREIDWLKTEIEKIK